MSVQTILLGHSGTVDILANGKKYSFPTITSFDVDTNAQHREYWYTGNAIAENYLTCPKWTGRIELVVRDSNAELLQDLIVGAVRAGQGYPAITFNVSENYSDGTSVSYVYTDITMTLAKRQGGGQEAVTKTFTWHAADREMIS